MADEIERPFPRFCFSVRFGDDPGATFQEMTGLQAETNAIEYRHGNSPGFTPVKMSAISSGGTVIALWTVRAGPFGEFEPPEECRNRKRWASGPSVATRRQIALSTDPLEKKSPGCTPGAPRRR